MRLRMWIVCLVGLSFPCLLLAQGSREPNMVVDELLASVAARTDIEFLVSAAVPDMIYVRQIAMEDVSYPLLLSILRNNGLAGLEVEGRTNIVPESDARALVSQIVQRDDPSIPDDLWVTRIIEVRDGAPVGDSPGRAAMLVPVLRPLLPQSAHLSAFPSSSSLVIVDRYANVRRITEIVNELTR